MDCRAGRHCEKRSDAAIAMTGQGAEAVVGKTRHREPCGRAAACANVGLGPDIGR